MQSVYFDEEECLGIDAFVNELELLAANGKHLGRVDQAQLLELLPKLAATILKSQENKPMLKSMQRECEPVFTELISTGVCPTVRRLICICLSRFYAHGDMLTIYSRINGIQNALSGKDPAVAAKPLSEGVRVGMVEVLAYLALHHGRYLTSAAAENMSIASKLMSKASPPLRVACLHLAAGTVEGMNCGDRTAASVQAEAWTLYLKASRERSCPETRAAATQVLSAIARSSGAALWRDGGFYWEEALRICNAGLSDPVQAVRDGHAMGLCDLAVAVRLEGIEQAIHESTRLNAKEALMKLKADDGAAAYRTAVLQPLVDAALQNRGLVCASLAQACCSYIGFAASHSPGNANVLVDLAVQVVTLCDLGARSLVEAKAQGVVSDATLGGALAGGEIPHLQACVLYILRTAVLEGLTEAGQRLLLHKLVELLQRQSCPVPTAVVALEGISILLDVLGEMSDEAMSKEVEAAVTSQVQSASNPVRQLAAQAVAALASAQPAAAAALLESLLFKLEACAMLLGGQRPMCMGPLQDAYDSLLGKTQPALMATAHGAALAAASVLMVALRLPLSIPGALPRQAYDLAIRLVTQQLSDSAATRALEREAGYIVLGAIISCWGAGTLSLSATRLVVPAAERAGGEGAAAVPDGGEPVCGEVLWCLSLALGESATKELDEGNCTQPGSDGELAMNLWWRSVALQTLRAYMTSIVNAGLVKNTQDQEKFIADQLAPVLAMVDHQVCMQDPHKAKGGPAGLLAACSATFQVRLLECIQLLDLTTLPPTVQTTLLRTCLKPVRAAGMAAAGVGVSMALQAGSPPPAVSSSIGYNPAVSAALHRTALQYVLVQEDAILGPWPLGRVAAEEELHEFSGERGAPHNQPWEAPLLTALFVDSQAAPTGSAANGTATHGAAGPVAATGQTAGKDTERKRGALYPQPIGLAPGLLAAQAAVLGRLLCVQSQGVQLQILDDLINAAVAGKNRQPVQGDREYLSRQRAAGTLVAVAALSGLNPLMRRVAVARSSADQLADRVLKLANALLDGGGSAELGLARAGGQLLAISACLGTETWAVKMVHAITDEISKSVAEGRDPERRAALCLALGSIHRFKGGLALQALVPASVGALLAAVKRPSGHAARWALHALSLCAASAGGAYVTHVKVTLQLCQDLMVSAEAGGFDIPGLRPACARLANSMVGVLGPEFTLGGTYYRMAKSMTSDLVQSGVLLVDDPQALSALNSAPASPAAAGPTGSAGSPGEGKGAPRALSWEALACELQAVLFAQQAILFAPNAVQASKHVPMLQAKLLSPRPALRKAAAATLFHLSKRDARLLLPHRIEGALFAALDSETDASIAGLLRELLRTLLAEGVKTQPSYWLSCLSEVVFSSSGGPGGENGVTNGNGIHEGQDEDDDDTPPAAVKPTVSVSGAPPAAGVAPGGSQVMQAALATVALRLRTRLFAAELLLRLVQCAGGLQSPNQEDQLVDKLQELVDVGYKLATGSTEALRPSGAQLLEAVLSCFAEVEDPLMPGARLLAQYQAQLVSALRMALTSSASPPLAVAGGRMATAFLESGSVAGDGQVMQRLMDMLTGPLAAWGQRNPNAGSYAEWVDVQQRVALLRAHAHCATLAKNGGDEVMVAIVGKAHAPYRSLLASLWTALLQDHAIITTQAPAVRQAYRSALLTAAAPPESLPPVDTSALMRRHQVEGPKDLGVFSTDMVEKVRDVFASACPVVLEAVTSHFPSAAEVQSSRAKATASSTGPSSLWSRYTSLLDVGVLLVLDSSRALEETVTGLTTGPAAASASLAAPLQAALGPQVTRLLSCLQGLRKLLDAEYVSAGLAATAVVAGVLHVLTGLVQSALLPLAWLAALRDDTAQPAACSAHLASLAAAVSDVIKEVAQGLSPAQFASPPTPSATTQPPLASTLLETILAASSVTTPYSVVLPAPAAPSKSQHTQHAGRGPQRAITPRVSGSGDSAGPAGPPEYLAMQLSLTPQSAGALDGASVSLLVAATLLLRKVPPESYPLVVPALLQLSSRLLCTAPAGVQLQAASRFLGTLLSTLATTASKQPKDMGGTLTDAWLTLSQLTQHVQAYVNHLRHDSAGATTTFSEAETARCGATLSVLLSATWHLTSATDLPPTSPPDMPVVATRLIWQSLVSALDVAQDAHGALGNANGVHPEDNGHTDPGSAVSRETAAQMLYQLRRLLLEAVRNTVHEGTQAQPEQAGQAAWAHEVMRTLGPHVVSSLHQLLTHPARVLSPLVGEGEPLEGVGQQAGLTVCEGIKVLVGAASLAATQGSAKGQAVCWALLGLMVEAASAQPSVTSVLGSGPRELSLKLLTTLPASALGEPFKSAVAALPQEQKARLQAALHSHVNNPVPAAAASAAQAPGSTGAKPTIQLKTNFGV